MLQTISIVLLLIYLLQYCNGIGVQDPIVAEYVDIIQQRIKESKQYTRPIDASAYKPSSDAIKEYDGPFDYIIVGSGSAGSVIASRLSERRKWNILLLEAGVQEDDFGRIPAMAPYVQGSHYNWAYTTVPQKNACLGMLDNKCAFPRGKGLGGSSLLNAMMYSRGNKIDYDKWAAEGNPGWSYKRVLPLFKKSEYSTIDGDFGYHGRRGSWNVEYHQPKNNTQVLAFLEANSDLGIPIVDYNGKRELGASQSQLNTIQGQRDSLARAFLLPVRQRTNLKILTQSYVVKILINNVSKITEGVLFSKEGILYKAKARKEVILSGGTINSPQLLMLSGIGPAQHLLELGIPVVQNLSVGENLQDHPTHYGLMFESNYTIPNIGLEEMVEEYVNGVGWLTVGYGAEALGFYQVQQKSNINPSYPDIELINVITNIGNDYLQEVYRYTNETLASLTSKGDGRRLFNILVTMLHPKSKGSIKLKSANPFDYPLIDPKLLDDPDGDDISLMYEGIQFALNLTKTKAFQKLNTTFLYVNLPQCTDYEYPSREYWYCIIKHLTGTLFHPTGTCKMGPDPKKGSVVNHQMKVYGVKNLRVADASIIPFALSGHTSAPTAMIGEYLSCLIKKERC